MKKRLLVYLMCVALVLTAILVCACGNVDVEAITIKSADGLTEIKEGETLQLTATITPPQASQEVKWSSSDSAKATVNDKGLVTAVAAGNVTITATSVANDKISKTFALIINAADPVVDNTPKTVTLTTANNATTVKIGETLKVTATVSPAAASQEVEWTTSDSAKATVNNGVVTGVAEGTVTITATSKSVATVKNSINITVATETVDEPSANFAEMEFSNHEQYIAIANNELLKVKGVVTFIEPTSTDAVNYYLQNGEDAFYIYAQDTTKFPVELGKVYAVGGAKTVYQNAHELKTIEYCEELNETITYTTVNLDGKDVSSADAMYPYHGAFVTANAEVTTAPTTGTKAYSINIKVGEKATTLRIDPKYMSADEFAAINNIVDNMIAGTGVEFTGILTHFGYGKTGTPQILIFKADALKVSEASPADKVDMVKNNLSVLGFVSADKNTITLPTESETFDDVVIAWASSNTDIITNAGAVTHPEKDTVVTLTATVSHKTETTATAQQSFKVNVAGSTFEAEKLLALDFEKVEAGNNYGQSATKSGYTNKDADGNITDAANTVEIDGTKWILTGTLISGSKGGDHCDGDFAGRMSEKQGKVETTVAGEYNYVQFDVATYNAQQHGTTVTVMYKMQGSDEWVETEIVITVDSYELTTCRVALAEGVKDIRIVVVSGSGKVNIDNIELYK